MGLWSFSFKYRGGWILLLYCSLKFCLPPPPPCFPTVPKNPPTPPTFYSFTWFFQDPPFTEISLFVMPYYFSTRARRRCGGKLRHSTSLSHLRSFHSSRWAESSPIVDRQELSVPDVFVGKPSSKEEQDGEEHISLLSIFRSNFELCRRKLRLRTFHNV